MTSRILPVGVVLKRIKQVLEDDVVLSDVWVEGEISKFQVWNSGHAYFTLKDDVGILDGMMWKTRVTRQSFVPRVGDQVLVNGSVTIYEARGQLQFEAFVFQPAGVGILQAQFEALRQKLDAEGLFDESRKRPIPEFPVRIGVATSPSGAVWHDIQRVIERRYPLVELVLAPSVVQGESAPKSLVNALTTLQQLPDIDVIIIGRGGGSIEDLWAFNDEQLVRAIFASRVPVISAVGHETDFTLSDFVADLRAPTPSAAAELAVPDSIALLQTVEGYRITAQSYVLASLQERLADVQELSHRLQHVSPLHQLTVQDATLDRLAARGRFAMSNLLHRHESRVDSLQAYLKGLDPHALLRRGYAQLTRADDGTLVSSAHELSDGDAIRATFSDGYADLVTTGIMSDKIASNHQSSDRGNS